MRWFVLVIVGCGAPLARPVVRVSTPAAGCAVELDGAIGRAKTELLPLLPADEAFVLGRRAPAHENRLRPILDGVFGTNPGGALTYRVECNANACKVDINPALVPARWQREVDTLETRAPEVVQKTQFVAETLYVTTTPIGIETWREVEGGDCASREAELRDYDAQLDILRPMAERFQELPEAFQRERILRAAIHITGHFEIECRGSICRVEGGSGVELLKHELRAMFDRIEVENRFEHVMWAEQRDGDVARGNILFEMLTAQLDRRRVAACQRLQGEPGQLEFQLVENGDTIIAQATGRRANTPASTCLRELINMTARGVMRDGPVQLPLRPLRFWLHSAS